MGFNLKQLSDAVQFNCDVADANFAGNYTMCTYLLKMRELYRWSASIEQSDKLLTNLVAEWVEQKEAYWESLEGSDFRPLLIDGHEHDPFDIQTINLDLKQHGLIYGAGYGRGCRPEFYLASLVETDIYDTCHVFISDHEYARDLSAPVAMSQENRIYVRKESVRRMLWEQIEAWRWRKSPDGAFSKALHSLPLDSDPAYALEQLVTMQMEHVINHEVGEVEAGGKLGDEWADMLMTHAGSKIEILARAIKDHLADTMVTLPILLDSADPKEIHLYFANMSAIRQELFPQLVAAYEQWCDTSSISVFKRLIHPACNHWLSHAEKMLDDFRNMGEAYAIRDDDIVTYRPDFATH